MHHGPTPNEVQRADGPQRKASTLRGDRRSKLNTTRLGATAACLLGFGAVAGPAILNADPAAAHGSDVYCSHYVTNAIDTCNGSLGNIYSNYGYTSGGKFVCVDEYIDTGVHHYTAASCNANAVAQAVPTYPNPELAYGRTWLNSKHSSRLFHKGVEYY